MDFTTHSFPPARPNEVHPFKLVRVDGLGNDYLYDFELPYDIDYRGFLLKIELRFGAQPCFKIHDESDYINWAKRLKLLSIDKDRITNIQTLIEKYKSTDFEKLWEWMWWPGCHSSSSITIEGDETFNALMAKAKAGELDEKGCFMRLSEARFREIAVSLKELEQQESHQPQTLYDHPQMLYDQAIEAPKDAVKAVAGDDDAPGSGALGE
ncbi:unnamed protein product [Discula destructiva]